MEQYSTINAILIRKTSTFEQFQTKLKQLKIQKETYLNLFLTTIVIHKCNSPHFKNYVEVLVNFKDFTGKKSANINYIGYKDKKSVLMHACAKGNKQIILYLLTYPNLNLQIIDPEEKNALFYAINNINQDESVQIMNLLLEKQQSLIQSKSHNNWTLLNEALEERKLLVIEFLLKKGANVNCQLTDTKNTLLHQLYKKNDMPKQDKTKIIVLLIKFKINLEIMNKQGKSNLDIVKQYKSSIQQFMHFKQLLDGQQSYIQSFDSEFDKASMTTFNIQTKIEEVLSERCQIQSNVCSLQIDFSCTDFHSEANHQNQDFQNFQLDDICEEQNVDFQLLSQEILQFSAINEERHQKAYTIIQPFIIALQSIASNFNLKLDYVGSFATGLWTNYSDIDINLVSFDHEFVNFEFVLQKIYRMMLSKRRQLSIVDIYLNKNKINSIKIGLNEFFNNYHIDISIFHRYNQNRKYVSFIVQALYNFPYIKPLFFIFRKICQVFKLHDYMQGGLKSYTLFLMIYNVLNQVQMKNLGEAFNYISFYYGICFGYTYELINQEQKIGNHRYQEAEMRINIYDPLNLKNNMGGKNTKAQQLQNMFRVIYYSINQAIHHPYLNNLFTLNQIF